MSLTFVTNVFPSSDPEERFSVFPVMWNKSHDTVTFVAHFSLDTDMNNLTEHPKLTLYPVHLRNTECMNNIDELVKKRCFAFVSVAENRTTLTVDVHNLPASQTRTYNGEFEVILKNNVVGDDAGDSIIVFPHIKSVSLRGLTDKFDMAIKVMLSEYSKYIVAHFNHQPTPELRALREKIRIDAFPETLLKIESISRRVQAEKNKTPFRLDFFEKTNVRSQTPAATREPNRAPRPAASQAPVEAPRPAASQARPPEKAPEKKGFFARLFS